MSNVQMKYFNFIYVVFIPFILAITNNCFLLWCTLGDLVDVKPIQTYTILAANNNFTNFRLFAITKWLILIKFNNFSHKNKPTFDYNSYGKKNKKFIDQKFSIIHVSILSILKTNIICTDVMIDIQWNHSRCSYGQYNVK